MATLALAISVVTVVATIATFLAARSQAAAATRQVELIESQVALIEKQVEQVVRARLTVEESERLQDGRLRLVVANASDAHARHIRVAVAGTEEDSLLGIAFDQLEAGRVGYLGPDAKRELIVPWPDGLSEDEAAIWFAWKDGGSGDDLRTERSSHAFT